MSAFLQGRGAQRCEPQGCPKPQENCKSTGNNSFCVNNSHFYFLASFPFSKKEIFPWEHGNI
jgi:hypothetical protein